jgi:hypothetical protein
MFALQVLSIGENLLRMSRRGKKVFIVSIRNRKFCEVFKTWASVLSLQETFSQKRLPVPWDSPFLNFSVSLRFYPSLSSCVTPSDSLPSVFVDIIIAPTFQNCK